uniref:NADH dehydrogenase subunit 6 n=1 Tax=Pomphorhynchus laevis TaxID=141832 RepID=A0A806H3A8_9BILA|nr:NADH dehydrogenase subunit 6 [Pomphorhynchus laevis]AFI44244.1 NADH dehydrogenase subunit 6 [Pomphorhynchus laevis]
MGFLLLAILGLIFLTSVGVKGYGGLAMNLWLIVGLLSVLWGFGHTSWEGWIMLSMVNVGGILVLMVYASSTDGYNKYITPPMYLGVGFVTLLYLFGVSASEPNHVSESLVYTESTGVLLMMSGLFLVLAMVVCNRMLGVGSGYLRGVSRLS